MMSLFLLFILCVSTAVFAEDQSTAKPVLRMLCIVDKNTPDIDNVVKQAIEKKFNVELKLEKSGSETAHFDKLHLLLAADDLPDIVAGFQATEGKTAGMKGALLAFNKYQSIMPNFFKWMKTDKNAIQNITAGDGNIYSAPRYDLFLRVNRVPIMRVDLLKKLNLPIPKTFDELYNTLKAIKAKYPSNLGMYSNFGYQDLTNWGFYFNTNVGYGSVSGMYYDRYQDKWVYGPTNEGYLEEITFFNKLWKDKLMDPEFFTTTTKMYNEKATNGNVAVVMTTDDASWKMELQHKIAYPTSDLDYEIVIPFRSISLPEPAVSMRQYVNSPWSWSVSAKTKYPELVCRIIDWMYSEEGSFQTTAGFEGVQYTFTQQNGKRVWKFLPEIIREYNPDGKYDPRPKYALRHPYWVRLNRDYYEEFTPENDFIQQHNETLQAMYKLPGYQRNNDNIELTFSDEQNDEMQKILTNLQTYVDENTVNFIIGERPLSEYPAFKKEMEKFGSKKLESIYAASYAIWKKYAK